jgi:putative tricarboxylic transport membrane protein
MKTVRMSSRLLVAVMLASAVILTACGTESAPSPTAVVAPPASTATTAGSDSAPPATTAAEASPTTGQAAGGSGYPNKPITIIVAYAPGGGADQSARVIASYATKKFGVPVNVTNVTGASGVTGMLEALQSPPDGYTLFLDGNVTSSFMYATRTSLPIGIEDRRYIARATTDYIYFFGCNNTTWKTIQEAVEFAKANPDQFIWGAGAQGSTPMFSQIDLFSAAGIDISKTRMLVFDQGNAASLQACGGGDVQMAIGQAPDVASMLATGRVKVLAVNSPERTPQYPDVPTMKEAGYPEADLVAWYGLTGPKDLPDDVVAVWNNLLSQTSTDPVAAEEATKVKKTWNYLPADQFKQFVLAEYQQILPVAEEMGLRK